MTRPKKPDLPDVPVNSAALAWVLNVTRRRVQQLVKEELLPAPVRYKYELIGCVMAYARYQRKTIEQQGSGSSNADLKKARVALLRAQKKSADLAYKQKIGQLIEMEDLQAVVNEGTAIFVGQKRSMGSRLAGKLAGMTDPTAILKLLNSENDKILAATADKLHALSKKGEA
jgi:phage terminase Nu1 subunit (DNA packaging protein)